MSRLTCTCSHCGRSYLAARVSAGANYCSTACRSKAYRDRKKLSDLAKLGTLDMDTYETVQMLTKAYGQVVGDSLMDIYTHSGANALRLACRAVNLVLFRETDISKNARLSA